MVWPRVKEGRGGYHQEDVKHASARKEKKGEAQEKMVGQYQGHTNYDTFTSMSGTILPTMCHIVLVI